MRKLTVALVVVALMSISLAAYAGWSRNCNGTYCVINPTGTWSCPAGQEWRLRSQHQGFTIFDSTGTGTFTLTSAGTNYRKYRTGEWDGTTWTWYTGRTSMTYAQVSVPDVHPHAIYFDVRCA